VVPPKVWDLGVLLADMPQRQCDLCVSGQIGQLLDDCELGLGFGGEWCVAGTVDDDGVHVRLRCGFGLCSDVAVSECYITRHGR
jgi:hypothetical protein